MEIYFIKIQNSKEESICFEAFLNNIISFYFKNNLATQQVDLLNKSEKMNYKSLICG